MIYAIVLLLNLLAPKDIVTYRWKYPYNTQSLIEDHFIVVDTAGKKGWYYGTTDDFDVGREGYQPGFYVAAMKDLRMTRDSISFGIAVKATDFFAAPVPLNIREGAAHKAAKWTVIRLNAEVEHEEEGQESRQSDQEDGEEGR